MRNELQRQRAGVEDLIAHEIGHRHFGRRDQVVTDLAAHGEEILLELRQLARALQRIGVDEIRHVHLGVTVLARVHVQHELAQRPMQARDRAAEHDEARAGDARTGVEVDAPGEPLSQLHVISRWKPEFSRRSPLAHLDVGVLVAAVGHGILQQVRQLELQAVEPGLHGLQVAVRRFELLAQALALREQRRGILPLGLRHAARTSPRHCARHAGGPPRSAVACAALPGRGSRPRRR